MKFFLDLGDTMTILGLILLLVGYLAGISLLVTIGWVLVVIGLVLLLISYVGNGLGGRRFW